MDAPPPPPRDLPPPKPPVAIPQAPPAYAYSDSPYQVAPSATSQLPYADFWIRFAAFVIDNVILSIALVVFEVVIGIVAGILLRVEGNVTGPPQSFFTLLTIILYLLSILYFIYYWGMGSTLGMRRFGIEIVDANTGQPIEFGRSTIRYVGYVISILVCYIGLIWAAFDPKKQGWHDKLANSVVIRP